MWKLLGIVLSSIIVISAVWQLLSQHKENLYWFVAWVISRPKTVKAIKIARGSSITNDW